MATLTPPLSRASMSATRRRVGSPVSKEFRSTRFKLGVKFKGTLSASWTHFLVQERHGVIGWIGIHPDDRDVKWISLAIVSMFLRYLLNKGVQNTLPILSCLGAH